MSLAHLLDPSDEAAEPGKALPQGLDSGLTVAFAGEQAAQQDAPGGGRVASVQACRPRGRHHRPDALSAGVRRVQYPEGASMIGLMYLMAAAVYLVIMIKAVGFAWKKGLASGSRKRAWIYGILAFLLVYLPVFWDHIPTVVAHKYYCAKDGGVHVYKHPQEWFAEHKGEIKNLRVEAGGEYVGKTLPDGWERNYLVNKDVAFEAKSENLYPLSGIEVWRVSERLFALRSKEILAISINYGTYRSFSSGGVKFWLNFPGCSDDYLQKWGEVQSAYSVYFKRGEFR